MENVKNGCSSPKMHPGAKLPITDPPKVWVSSADSVQSKTDLPESVPSLPKPKSKCKGELEIETHVIKKERKGNSGAKNVSLRVIV